MRWREEWKVRGELRRQVPDGILLAIGLNDTARIGRANGRPQLTPEAYKFGLQQLIREMKAHTKVMVMGLTPVKEEAMPFADFLWYSNEAGKNYENKIEEACLRNDVPFLPLHQPMRREKEWINWLEPDGIHLNSHGHKWIYQRVINWRPILSWAKDDS